MKKQYRLFTKFVAFAMVLVQAGLSYLPVWAQELNTTTTSEVVETTEVPTETTTMMKPVQTTVEQTEEPTELTSTVTEQTETSTASTTTAEETTVEAPSTTAASNKKQASKKTVVKLEETVTEEEERAQTKKAAHLRTLLPIGNDGDIQLVTSNQAVTQLALVGNDNRVQYAAPSTENEYVAVNPKAREQWESVKNEFATVRYEDLYALLNPYVRATDRLTLQIQLQKSLGRTPTTTEVDHAVKAFYMDKLDMRASFDRVKANLEQLMLGVLERSTGVTTGILQKQKLHLLLGLTYLERQYSFKFKGLSASRLLLLHPEVFGRVGTTTALTRLNRIGQLTYADLELGASANTYVKKFSAMTGQATVQDFIDRALNLFAPEMTGDAWFKATTKAYIVEVASQRRTTSLYEKMRSDERLKNHLIALLTLTSDRVYAISTMSSVTYGLVDSYVAPNDASGLEQFKTDLTKYGQQQEAFFDTWYRITDKKDELLHANLLVVDTMQIHNPSKDTAEARWSPATGTGANQGVREFFTPLKLYRNYLHAGAEAVVGSGYFSYSMIKALTLEGQETFTHEVTHLLDKTVWLNGQDKRTGQWPEVYARGLFEINDGTIGVSSYKPMFGFNFSYELGEQRTQNASPNRFASEADLQPYMKGLMDVIYTLDYAEAQSSLKRSPADKVLLYHQMTLVPETNAKRGANQTRDKISTITEAQAEKLKTVHDLVDHQMVASRLTFQGILGTGEVTPNGYYAIPLFNPIYAALQQDAGSVGDLSFRRNAYELLAAYGYKGGMIPYISNQHGGTDQAALQAILPPSYNGKLTTFKKAMFQERMNKVNHLKPVDGIANFTQLQSLMDQAVAKDLEQIKLNKRMNRDRNHGVSAVEALKLRVYQGYLRDTDDFRSSIYQATESTVSETEVVEIQIETKEEQKADLWEGERETVLGKVGRKQIVRTWKTVNGAKQGGPEIEETILEQMVPTIVYKGTKPIKGQKVTAEEVEIPITDQHLEDKNLEEGQTRTVEGTVGRKRITTTQPTEKDQPVDKATVKEEVITHMVPRKIYKGTKKVTTTTTSQVEQPKTIVPKPVSNLKEVYRLHHAKTKEYFYTVHIAERDKLVKQGWKLEGVAWKTETKIGAPVYRLYNPTGKYYFYTKNVEEYDKLGKRGWRKEGTAYRSYGSVPVYRLHDAKTQKYFYTRHTSERDLLVSRGWKSEGIAWHSQP